MIYDTKIRTLLSLNLESPFSKVVADAGMYSISDTSVADAGNMTTVQYNNQHIVAPLSLPVFHDISMEQMTNLFLYGSLSTPSRLDSESLIRASSASTTIRFDAASYMTEGAGRYASPARF